MRGYQLKFPVTQRKYPVNNVATLTGIVTACTVKKILRLLDAILDLSRIENGYIWNSIHFAFDGGFSLLRLDIPNSIQLYPKRNREKNGIPSNRDRI